MPERIRRVFYRLASYLGLMLVYLYLMELHAPGGFGWQDYHAYRILNSVEYLRQNGYFANYGFSIWSSCSDCVLTSSVWENKVYLSGVALIQLLPYIAINVVLGGEALLILGPLLDKAVVFITGALSAELFIRMVSSSRITTDSISIVEVLPPIPPWWLSLSIFTLFITSTWAYQMQRAMWNDVWFLLFFTVSLVALFRNRFLLGCVMMFVAGLMHYLSGFVLAFVLLVFSTFSIIYRERSTLMSFIPGALHQLRRLWIYCLFALAPAFIHLGLQALYKASSGQVGQGSSLLFRIGISGDDIYNGGIVGALQFLGGVRVTQCISMLGAEGLQGASLISKISAFNCSLSILGMFLLSALSVLGVIWLLRTRPATRPLLFPVVMILLITAAVLQQSFSVHLLGHSYPFALLFAFGLVGLCLKGAEIVQSRSLCIVLFTPIIVACVLLSVRVSMLSATLAS
jgi:hypothetical protein